MTRIVNIEGRDAAPIDDECTALSERPHARQLRLRNSPPSPPPTPPALCARLSLHRVDRLIPSLNTAHSALTTEGESPGHTILPSYPPVPLHPARPLHPFATTGRSPQPTNSLPTFSTPPSRKSLPPSSLPHTPTNDGTPPRPSPPACRGNSPRVCSRRSRSDWPTAWPAALDLDFTSLTKHRVEGDAPRAPGQHLLSILLAVDHHHRRTCEIPFRLHHPVHPGPDLKPATQHQQQWRRCPEHCRIRGSDLAACA